MVIIARKLKYNGIMKIFPTKISDEWQSQPELLTLRKCKYILFISITSVSSKYILMALKNKTCKYIHFYVHTLSQKTGNTE